MKLISQQFDWLRFGPLGQNLLWRDIQQRFDYIDIQKTNHFGRWYVDITGDQFEIVRMVEPIKGVLDHLAGIHWTRLDVAFDLQGVDITQLRHPGSIIVNDNRIETIYSHRLGSRGDYPVFARVYDAIAAGHDSQGLPDLTRAEVEFKSHMPDHLKSSLDWPTCAFLCAAFHLSEIFGLTIFGIKPGEWFPSKRVISHEREKFYARFGRRILADVAEMGELRYMCWLRECIGWQPE